MTWNEWQESIQKYTESFLSQRKRKKLAKLEARKHRNPVVEWAFIILQVIVIVILVNLFLFQNYRIPSESMVPELQIGDLIFVEKLSFGPEILPGQWKFPALRPPRRGEVVSFESQDYARQGPWVEFWQRFIFMITFTTVNLKVNEFNEPVKDLLIKRVIGLPGERIRIIRGYEAEILPEAEITWVSERLFEQEMGHFYTDQPGQEQDISDLWDQPGQDQDDEIPAGGIPLPTDTAEYTYEYYNAVLEYKAAPHDAAKRKFWLAGELGFYIPPNRFFPMGDNRGRSRDAREYGPVLLTKIQGKALFRWLPLGRIGAIR
jgi:signal peptidase I